MSWWIWPTTADVGIRVFSSTKSSLIDEVIYGMQNVVFSDDNQYRYEECIVGEFEWNHANDRTLDRLIVRILEEVLYMSEVENKWIIGSQSLINEDQIRIVFRYIESSILTRDVEIKAVTRHSLDARELVAEESIAGIDGIPEMIGPGWFASVVFDL
jgi:SHS2 domain-containing protein